MLNDKQKAKLKKAILDKKVIDATTLKVFEQISELEEKVETIETTLKEEVKGAVAEIKGEKIDLNKVLESVRGQDGKDSIVPGPQGEQGIQGEKGLDGKDGVDGKDGKDGRDGVDGLDGKDGVDGQDGLPGNDGSPDTRQQIVEKINSGKKKDLKIAVNQIEGFEKTKTDLDFAIGVLDKRTQFLINKPSGGSGSGTVGPGTTNEIAYFNSSTTVGSLSTATYPSLTELSYVKGVTSAIQTQINTKANTSGSLTQFVGNTAWRVGYTDGSGDWTELALGADGTFLKSNGAAAAPTFAVPAGSGDVSKVGTPVNNQIAIWTGDGTIEGDADLVFDGSVLTSSNRTDADSVQVAIFQGDRATMADNDEAYLSFKLSDDGGTQTEVARITWVATDVNAGTNVDGRLDFSVMIGGSLEKELRLTNTSLDPVTDDGLTLGTVGARAWKGLALATGATINWDNSDIVITHSSNTLTFSGGTIELGTATGNLTGNVTGNVSGTAATVTGAAQIAITSVGTLTALDVDNININGNTISSSSGAINLVPLAGQHLNLTLGTTGDLVVNTNQFYVDTSAGTIGMGTTAPASAAGVGKFFEIKAVTAGLTLTESGTGKQWDIFNDGAGSLRHYNTDVGDVLTLLQTGFVGVGTGAPDANLTVLPYMSFKNASGVTKGYVGTGLSGGDTTSLIVRGEDLILFNLAGGDEAALSTTALYPTTDDGLTLGIVNTNEWADAFFALGAVIGFNNNDVTLTHSANLLTLAGGDLALGANSLTLTGSIASTGSRVTKGWFTDLEVTNAIVGSITGTAAVATTATIADEATDTTCFINFTTAATGNLGIKSNTNMTFNSNTGVATFASTVLTTTDINGGTIDGAVIGGASAAAGTFTTVSGTTITASTGFALGDGDYVGVTANERLVFNTAGTIVATGADFRIETANVGTNADSVPTISSTSTFTNKTLTTPTLTSANVGTDIAPTANDGATLGTATEGFADLYMATGANILINNANARRTLILTAAGGAPTTTAGCSATTKVEYGTNDIDTWVLDFDAASDEFAFWNVQMPDNYDGGTITAKFIWTNAGGGAAETVAWGIQGRAYADSDALDQASGTAIVTSDTWLAQNDVHISAASSAITLAGTPAGGQYVQFKVHRDVSADTLTGDARLMAVHISYGINKYSDV